MLSVFASHRAPEPLRQLGGDGLFGLRSAGRWNEVRAAVELRLNALTALKTGMRPRGQDAASLALTDRGIRQICWFNVAVKDFIMCLVAR
ncbi:hypothetical protein EYF80_011763 [Liparis tanakae]|uniref:Uncharacterized protein n=1 Tax=Liparis tanakae TaxID=230148 RepID=A0A4Z2IJ54_9TELE|nr:hypothetical protein EYF80_011763 [Liparis tanakae]